MSGSDFEPRLGGDRKGPDLIVAHALRRLRHLVEHHVDATGHQVEQRRIGAAIGHELQMGAGEIFEIDAGNVRAGADARGADGGARVGLDPGDELGEVLRRQRVAADHQHRIGRQLRDRLEIAQQIVGQRVDRAVDHVRAPVADAQRVAVGCRFRDAADADAAGGAGDVFDDDILPERAAHMLGHQAPHHVGRAAGGERHHHGDRPRRIIVGGSRQRSRRSRASGR